MDWFVVALFAVPGLLSAALVVPTPRWPVVVAVSAGGAVLLARRRAPLWTAAAIGVLACLSLAATGDSFGYELGVALALYAVAASRPPLVAWTAFAALTLTVSGATLLWLTVALTDTGDISLGGPEDSLVAGARTSTIVGVVVFALVAMAIGTSVRARRLHVTDLVERANSIARDRGQQAQLAAAAERARIAREMHDVVAHSLTVMVALADGAKIAGAKDPALAAHALDELTRTGRSAIADMRRVLGVLRDPDGEDAVPLTPTDAEHDLDDVVEPFRTAGLPVRVVQTGAQPELEPGLRHAVHRIVSESLTNVLRYAPLAPVVVVDVTRRDERGAGGADWLDLRIVNHAGAVRGDASPVRNGPATRRRRPRDASVGTGRGIIGMRERAAMYSGTVTAGPTKTGWEVAATLRLDLHDPRPAPNGSRP